MPVCRNMWATAAVHFVAAAGVVDWQIRRPLNLVVQIISSSPRARTLCLTRSRRIAGLVPGSPASPQNRRRAHQRGQQLAHRSAVPTAAGQRNATHQQHHVNRPRATVIVTLGRRGLNRSTPHVHVRSRPPPQGARWHAETVQTRPGPGPHAWAAQIATRPSLTSGPLCCPPASGWSSHRPDKCVRACPLGP